MQNNVQLTFANGAHPLEARSTVSIGPVGLEHVTITGIGEWDYSCVSVRNYLAIHDLKLVDGEIFLDGKAASRLHDLRGLLTFVPPGCSVTGWSRTARRKNSFTALFYDPSIIEEELEQCRLAIAATPKIYFRSSELLNTLNKLQPMASSYVPSDALYVETLTLLAAIEVDRLLQAEIRGKRASGSLSRKLEKMVCDYIAENLDQKITLTELAALAKLSRYHFIRAFRRTTGMPPHQFVTHARIERAKQLLLDETISLKLVAARVGFANQSQFSETFRKVVGSPPGRFRQSGGSS